jgi:hypothetical protein
MWALPKFIITIARIVIYNYFFTSKNHKIMNLVKFSKIVAGIAMMFTMLAAPNIAKAQAMCPYVLTNNLNCQVTIQYTIFSPNCGSFTNTVTISPNGGTYTINCYEFPGGCETADIECLLTWVDNIYKICKPPYTNGVASNNQSADASGIFPGAACTSIHMVWTPNGCIIKP